MSGDAGRKIVGVDLLIGSRTFRYVYGFECAEALVDIVLREVGESSSILLLVDSGVRPYAATVIKSLQSGGPRIASITVSANEQLKRLPLVCSIMERAVAAKVDRKSVVVAMGGGLLGNIAGMVAALLYRGLPLIHLPTTPVAAFDSVLSAKQAVNLKFGKNLCGTYLVPTLVACDLSWLQTVPNSQMLAGCAEMAKNVLAVLPAQLEPFFEAIELGHDSPEKMLTFLLQLGIEAKTPFLVDDSKESQGALIFEYGHTVGHALEFASVGRMLHGEAVAWGMLTAAEVARQFCGLSDPAWEQHQRVIQALGLTKDRLSAIGLRKVKELLTTDNKRGHIEINENSIAMVLLESLGRPAKLDDKPIVSVPLSLVESSMDRILGGDL